MKVKIVGTSKEGFFFGVTAPSGPWPPSFTRFLDHTQRRTTVDRTPMDDRSAGTST